MGKASMLIIGGGTSLVLFAVGMRVEGLLGAASFMLFLAGATLTLGLAVAFTIDRSNRGRFGSATARHRCGCGGTRRESQGVHICARCDWATPASPVMPDM